MTTTAKNTKKAAQTLRYAGFQALCVINNAFEQSYEIRVFGIDAPTAKELQVKMCEMFRDDRINVINA